MPGEQRSDALAAAERYKEAGIFAVFTLLGENLTEFAEGEAVAAEYQRLLADVVERKLHGEISLKLTQLGFDIDAEGAYRLFDQLAVEAASTGNWVWIDMEGSAYTERTVAFYERALAAHQNVGLCLQAYLLRTPADVQRLLPKKPAIRLVKGAYDEPASIALHKRTEVSAAYLAVASMMLEALAAGRMSRAILATHDTELVGRIAGFPAAFGLAPARIEVQMLYGIRAAEQRRLVAEGYDASALIAYGTYWYPWYMRRLAERPANVIFALRQLLP